MGVSRRVVGDRTLCHLCVCVRARLCDRMFERVVGWARLPARHLCIPCTFCRSVWPVASGAGSTRALAIVALCMRIASRPLQPPPTCWPDPALQSPVAGAANDNTTSTWRQKICDAAPGRCALYWQRAIAASSSILIDPLSASSIFSNPKCTRCRFSNYGANSNQIARNKMKNSDKRNNKKLR